MALLIYKWTSPIPDMIKKKSPHVMVSDLKGPGMDGKAVLRQVKMNLSDIQGLILTGHGSEKEAKEMLHEYFP